MTFIIKMAIQDKKKYSRDFSVFNNLFRSFQFFNLSFKSKYVFCNLKCPVCPHKNLHIEEFQIQIINNKEIRIFQN